MSEPKRHHYLPQFYQLGFTLDGKNLCLYDRKLNEMRPARPRNTALIGHYNSFTEDDGTKNTVMETYLCAVEGRAASAIKAAFNQHHLTGQQRANLAEFIAFQFYRVPRFDSELKEMMKAIFRHGMPQEAADSIDGSRNLTLSMMWNLVPEIKRIILLQDWFFLHCPPGSSFVTSDSPFTIIPPKPSEERLFATNGICMPGVKKWFPLTSRLGLMMGDRGDKVLHSNVFQDQIDALNAFIAIGSFQYLLARDKSTLEDLIAKTGIDKNPPIQVMGVV